MPVSSSAFNSVDSNLQLKASELSDNAIVILSCINASILETCLKIWSNAVSLTLASLNTNLISIVNSLVSDVALCSDKTLPEV